MDEIVKHQIKILKNLEFIIKLQNVMEKEIHRAILTNRNLPKVQK
jgi:hypothetical protein